VKLVLHKGVINPHSWMPDHNWLEGAKFCWNDLGFKMCMGNMVQYGWMKILPKQPK